MNFSNLRLVLLLCLIPLLAHAVPPTGTQLEAVLLTGLTREPTRKAMTNLTTTLVDAVDADVVDRNGNAVKNDAATQMLVVVNLDDTTDVCVGSVPLSTSETCNETLCSTAAKWTAAVDAATPGNAMAAAGNCTHGDASMLSVVPKGQSREFRFAGNRCPCMVASGASTDVQVDRVIR